jgi:hypothetical protein
MAPLLLLLLQGCGRQVVLCTLCLLLPHAAAAAAAPAGTIEQPPQHPLLRGLHGCMQHVGLVPWMCCRGIACLLQPVQLLLLELGMLLPLYWCISPLLRPGLLLLVVVSLAVALCGLLYRWCWLHVYIVLLLLLLLVVVVHLHGLLVVLLVGCVMCVAVPLLALLSVRQARPPVSMSATLC